MSVSRRADLDWLRVLAFGLLIAYHAGMAWSGWSWHLTSSDSIDWLREGMRFTKRMPSRSQSKLSLLVRCQLQPDQAMPA